jgi:hypothetical protein
MRPLIAILVLLVASVATADLQSGSTPAGPENLRLTGPVEVLPGETVTVIVHGLPAVDLALSIGEQTAWIETLRIVLDTPGAAIDVDKELSMTVAPWGWRLRVSWTADEPGVYLLVCDWNQAPFGLALHRVTIRGPPDPPSPPPPPPPGRVSRVVIIEESGDRTPEVAAILTDPRLLPLRQAGKLLVLDQDAADSTGQPAAELSQYDGQPLPRVIGLDSSGVRSVAGELPGSGDGLVELLKTWGVL